MIKYLNDYTEEIMEDKKATTFYKKGVQYNSESKYKLAINNFIKALELEPDFTEAQFDLGIAYLKTEEYDSAINCFYNVLNKNENETFAQSNLALAYLKKGEYKKSIDLYFKLLSTNPEDPEIILDLAYAYVRNQQYDQAIVMYNQAMKFGSHRIKAEEGLNTALNLQKSKKEQEAKKDKINQYHQMHLTPEHYFDLAVDNVREQDLDEAIKNLRNCLKANKNYSKASVLLDRILEIKEKKMNASFVNHTKLNESYKMGVSFYYTNKHLQAKEKFKDCLRFDPNHKLSQKFLQTLNKNMI